jgi:hypothetical protein
VEKMIEPSDYEKRRKTPPPPPPTTKAAGVREATASKADRGLEGVSKGKAAPLRTPGKTPAPPPPAPRSREAATPASASTTAHQEGRAPEKAHAEGPRVHGGASAAVDPRIESTSSSRRRGRVAAHYPAPAALVIAPSRLRKNDR